MARRGVRADLVPERFVAESLLDAFPRRRRARVLLAARRGRRATCCPRVSRDAGYAVEVLGGLPHRAGRADPSALARVRAGEVDAVTFTSSSTVDNFCDRGRRASRPAAAVVSIGPVTSETARRAG